MALVSLLPAPWVTGVAGARPAAATPSSAPTEVRAAPLLPRLSASPIPRAPLWEGAASSPRTPGGVAEVQGPLESRGPGEAAHLAVDPAQLRAGPAAPRKGWEARSHQVGARRGACTWHESRTADASGRLLLGAPHVTRGTLCPHRPAGPTVPFHRCGNCPRPHS